MSYIVLLIFLMIQTISLILLFSIFKFLGSRIFRIFRILASKYCLKMSVNFSYLWVEKLSTFHLLTNKLRNSFQEVLSSALNN